MNDISEILRALLDQYSNTDSLDQEFQRMLDSDRGLKEDYSQWCEDQGYGKAMGYREFINEIVEDQETIWDHYHEYGNDI